MKPVTRTALIRAVGRACDTTWNHQLTPDLAAPCLSYIVLAADAALKKLDGAALIDLAYPCARGKLPSDDDQDIRHLFGPGAPPSAILLANSDRSTSIPLVWTDVGVTFEASEVHAEPVVVALRARDARAQLNSYIVDICAAFFSSAKASDVKGAFNEIHAS